MKRFMLIILSLILLFIGYNNPQPAAANSVMEKYSGPIEHVFTHCLLAFPELALQTGNPMKNSYNKDCITKNEFKQMLQKLYSKNFALIDINTTFEVIDGKAVKKQLYMPKGKKPLILSFDDVNYDRKKMHLGMVDKIILDKNNNLATSTVLDGKEIISYDNEFIPILEGFIKQYPDFSVNGAKGTINLTGYDGLLGYRTNKNSSNRDSEIKKVKPIIKRLKENGWNFACHSYGHYHMKKISDAQFQNEINSWNEEMVPLIGKTNIYVYPYGEWEILNPEKTAYSNKHKKLLDDGFKLFCGVGMKPFFSYMPINPRLNLDPPTLFMDRKVVDGFSLTSRKKELQPLFNASEVYDYAHRI